MKQRNSLGLIGESGVFLEAVEALKQLAASAAPVLILGETGTGKEVFAKALHALGPRATQPFVPLNMSALPETLAESELFGHARGAFTGAVHDRKGAMVSARDGTLFLDEIGELPLAIQAKLLRVLEDGSFRKLGSDRQDISDVRLVAATNRELKNADDFREDLYYRLSTLTLHIPPLRARKDDIEHIAPFLLEKIAHSEKISVPTLSPQAIDRLMQHNWPGNIRELKNILTRATALHRPNRIMPDMLDIEEQRALAENIVPFGRLTALPSRPKPLWLQEKDAIEEAIRFSKGNIPQAAALLEVSPSTLYRKKQEWESQPTNAKT